MEIYVNYVSNLRHLESQLIKWSFSYLFLCCLISIVLVIFGAEISTWYEFLFLIILSVAGIKTTQLWKGIIKSICDVHKHRFYIALDFDNKLFENGPLSQEFSRGDHEDQRSSSLPLLNSRTSAPTFFKLFFVSDFIILIIVFLMDIF